MSSADTPLRRGDISLDPVEQFARWFADAGADPRIVFAEAACLSTLGPGDTPEGRMVLLKHFDARGFVFYTNLGSAKSRALERHARAGLTFYWQPLGRQVRVRGAVEAVTDAEADAYFATRPRGSQLGAWASDQSRVLDGRGELEARLAAAEARHAGGGVPRPPHWSGFRIVPDAVEFWREGAARLHDRFEYRRGDGDAWEVRRLYP